MKRLMYLLPLLLALFLTSFSYADDIEVIKKGNYSLSLESNSVKANSSIMEIFDIDTIGNKIPDQIIATVESGDWVSSLPNTVTVADADNNVDKIIENWDINFAKAKNGGRVIFTRVITNNDDVDRESYAWDLKIKYRFIKYR
ncbi:MAG: hypothetical protein HZA47_11715 [Planctomycetes bacterium]|uniref:hypothetical protein n=1 Tax=Candidatus Wunengus sp. YC65 TaxID=3367701 RepID=UPI001D20E69E|nr:hypothetical protein [Planctomycetota bacterium]